MLEQVEKGLQGYTDCESEGNSAVARISAAIALAFSLFQIYTAGFGVFNSFAQRSLHVGFALLLCYLTYPISRKIFQRRDKGLILIFFSVSAVISTGYILIDSNRILSLPGLPATFGQSILGTLLLIIILDATRRSFGWFFPIFTLTFVLYAFLGSYLPGTLQHSGINFERYIQALYLSSQGIWGQLTGISANVVAIFIIFGSVFMATGAASTFFEIAALLVGGVRGGGALMAILVSSLFGTINGIAVANAATVGTITIQMMKRLGYKPEFAAGVEAAASTGGQILPPVMGAGAFLLAEIVGVPYYQVMIAAILPAILFYIGCFATVYLEALKDNLKPLSRDERPSIKDVLTLRKCIPTFIPCIILVWLIAIGYSPQFSAFWAMVFNIILFIVLGEKPQGIRKKIIVIVDALIKGGRGIVSVAVLIVAAQVVVSTINLTGFGIKAIDITTSLSGGSLPIALLIAAGVCIVISMGMPTVPAYALVAATVAPVLIQLGVDPLSANLFVYYYACLSNITPPVAPGVYVTAGIAESKFWPTAWSACRIGLVAFIVPFIFIYQGELLLQGPFIQNVGAILTSVLGVVILSIATSGWLWTIMSWKQRATIGVAGILLIDSSISTNAIGLILSVLVGIWNFAQSRYIHTKTNG